MADVKISGLPAATTPLGGTEVLPIVQGTTTKKVSVDNLTAGKAVSALSVTATTVNGTTFDTNVASAGVTLAGTTLAADGTDANININLVPKGTGQVVINAGTASLPAIAPTGDPNTGVFFPAADTIAFAEGGAESMRVDSSGNFIVGDTSNYGVRSLIAGAGAAPSTGNGSNNIVLALRDTTAGAAGVGAGIAFLGNDGANTGVTFGTINGTKEVATSGNYAASLVFKTRANGLSLVEQMRIASNGNVTLATGNLVIGTSGKGIDFSVTSGSAGTGTSELFSDYEEGYVEVTATPQTSGTITLDSSVNRLQYTKIGRMVYISGMLQPSAISSPVGGYVTISPLPFTVASSTKEETRSGNSMPWRPAGSGDYSAAASATVSAGGTSFLVWTNANTWDDSPISQLFVSLSYVAA